MKKGIFALIGIVLVLALVLGFKIINTKKNTSYTPAQIKEKILSAFNYTNYTYTYTQDGITTTKKVRGNIIVTENNTNYTWIDGNAMSMVSIDKEKNVYLKTNLNSSTKELLFKKDFLDMKNTLNSYGDELYYLQDEIYNGKDCIRIQAKKDEQYLIDKKTGFVLKYEPSTGSVGEFSVELDNVTENDIKLPDLANYERAN